MLNVNPQYLIFIVFFEVNNCKSIYHNKLN